MNITKANIVDEIAKNTGLTKIDTKTVVDGVLACIMNAIAQGERIELRGFGVFKTKHRKPRAARNPRTGEVVALQERYVPVFKISPEFAIKVNESLVEKSKAATKTKKTKAAK